MTDEIERLRAELAAERERADKAEAEFDRLSERMRVRMVECGEKLDGAAKERDKLRAELVKRHELLVLLRNYLYFLPSKDAELLADIEAALGGRDE